MIEALMGITPDPGTLNQQHYLGRKHEKIHSLSPADQAAFNEVRLGVCESGATVFQPEHFVERKPVSPVGFSSQDKQIRPSSSPQARLNVREADMHHLLTDGIPTRFSQLHPQDFEDLICRLFRDTGFVVNQTSYSGDYGADLIASKRGSKHAIQVKRYCATNRVGVGDVNQIIGAKSYYSCDHALVITTSGFTKSATELARKTRVHLWDWDELQSRFRTAYLRSRRRWFWPFRLGR